MLPRVESNTPRAELTQSSDAAVSSSQHVECAND